MAKRRRSKTYTVQSGNKAINFQSKAAKGSTQIATRQASPDFYIALGQSLPNPDPVLKKLGRDVEVYEDLLADARVQAAVSSRKSGVLSRDWVIERNGVPMRQYRLIEDIFNDYDIQSLIDQMLDGMLYGYQPTEITWAKMGEFMLPKFLVPKPARWFRFGLENELRFLTRANQTYGVPVPPRKFLLSRNAATYDNPYGNATLSSVFWPVTFRKNGYRFWTTFLEKYGMPWVTAKAAAGDQEDRIEEVATMLENMVQDAIAVVPNDYEINLTSNNQNQATDAYKTYLDAVNVEIAIAILGTNLTTEVQGGSLAAANAHMDVREDLIRNDARMIEGTFNKLIKWIYQINFGGSQYPEFKIEEPEEIGNEIADRDKKLKDIGVNFTADYIMRTYNLNEGDFTISEALSLEPGAGVNNEDQ